MSYLHVAASHANLGPPEICVLCGYLAPNPAHRVRACSCGYSHQVCVVHYVVRRENKHPNRPVFCHRCHAPYRVTPAKTPLVQTLENINYVWLQGGCRLLVRACSFVLFDAFVCVVGLDILMGAVGQEECLRLVDGWSPLLVANACRLATLAAVAANRCRCWEDAALATLHRWSVTPYVGWLLPQGARWAEEGQNPLTFVRDKPPSPLCCLVEGLMLPKIAKVFGHLFFTEYSNLNRFLLGGLTFLTLRGLVGMYYKHKLFSRQVNLTVENFHEE